MKRSFLVLLLTPITIFTFVTISHAQYTIVQRKEGRDMKIWRLLLVAFLCSGLGAVFSLSGCGEDNSNEIGCLNIAGNWDYTHTSHQTTETATATVTMTGTLMIQQMDCQVSLDWHPERTGTIEGNSIQLVGMALPELEGDSLTENSYTAQGTIGKDQIIINGIGSSEGTMCRPPPSDCFQISMSLTDEIVLTR